MKNQSWPFANTSTSSGNNTILLVIFFGFIILWWLAGLFKAIGIGPSILAFLTFWVGFAFGRDLYKRN